MQPEFMDGKPINLEAAALDALEWLEFWRGYLNYNHLGQEWNESRRRMSGAIEALEYYLPKGEPVFHDTPGPSVYGAATILGYPIHPELEEQ